MGDYNTYLRDFLASRGYTAKTYAVSDYAGVISRLNGIVVVILHRVSSTTGFDRLLTVAATQQKGLIFASQYAYSSHGLGVLRSRKAGPSLMSQYYSQGTVRMNVVANHPIFDGYPSGIQVTIINGGDNDYQTYSGYTGTTIGQNAMSSGYTGMVGYKDRAAAGGARHVITASFGSCQYTRLSHRTTDGRNIFVNAIEWARSAK